MLTGVIQEKTVTAVQTRLNTLSSLYDAVELRLDALEAPEIPRLGQLKLPCPSIFTLRPQNQGGAFDGSEDERHKLLFTLAQLQPSYLDLEYDSPSELIQSIQAQYPNLTIILSYHNFEQTPQDLPDILERMRQKAPAAMYKIAAHARSLADTLRMLLLCRQLPERLIAISMGEEGISTRILAPILHSGICYCPVDKASAPGQLDAITLCSTYNFKRLNKKTQIYALLGSPVEQSIGHIFHNQLNREQEKNAVYVKWDLPVKKLGDTIPLLKQFDPAGLSVTMPLKESLSPWLDRLDKSATASGSVNTIAVDGKKWIGHNTDALGALKALGMQVRDKQGIILGAGGAAKAIIHELQARACQVQVFNRTIKKNKLDPAIMHPLNALSETTQQAYDFIINTLPPSVHLPLAKNFFRPGALAMDISYGADSTFLKAARDSGCRCKDGLAMFYEQALLQRQIWKLQ